MDQVELELTASFKASGIASDIAYSVVTIGYLCLVLVAFSNWSKATSNALRQQHVHDAHG